MIGTLPISSPLLSTLVLPTTGVRPLPTGSVAVAGVSYSPGAVPAVATAPQIQAQAILPTSLVNVPALPPPPSDRPVVQAGMPIPTLSPAAVLTSLAPAFASPGFVGPSAVNDEPPNDARLLAPMLFGIAATIAPVAPGNGLGFEPSLPAFVAPNPLAAMNMATSVLASASGAAPSIAEALPAAAVAAATRVQPSTASAPGLSWLLMAAGVAGLALVGGVAYGALRKKGKR